MKLPLVLILSLALLSPLNWMEEFKLLPSDGSSGDLFGYSVAISGNTAIVGARHGDGEETNSGAAYLFDTTTGAEFAKLAADDGANDDRFGVSVAISGNTAIVGSHADGGGSSGSARSGTLPVSP